MQNPSTFSLSMPAEWAPHVCTWTAWPSAAEYWKENLAAAQSEFVELCRALSADGGDALEILVRDSAARNEASQRLAGLPVTLRTQNFGDIWLRDTAPIFLTSAAEREPVTARFGFNGWGNKFVMDGDTEVAQFVARQVGAREIVSPLILEGGSVEVDGEGTCLTSKQCLLNDNRNPTLDQSAIEAELKRTLGVEKILWLGDGLINDHTDGHIDTIARFVAPGKVLCMRADNAADPNFKILGAIESDLRSMVDARGRRLDVHFVPSPGAVRNGEGDLMPASYLNFYIGNKTVVVPTYGSAPDEAAVRAIASHFPRHRTVGLSAHAILSGGGAFHCITQQQPTPGVLP